MNTPARHDNAAAEIARWARRLRWSFAGSARDFGRHVGRRLGSAGEFEGYRPFEPGDDLGALDLRAYGRLRQRLVRVHREDSVVPITLLIDRSGSARLPDRQQSIADWTRLLCATAQAAGDPIRVFTFGTGCLRAVTTQDAAAGKYDPRTPAQNETPLNETPGSATLATELRTLPTDPRGRGAVILLGDGFGVQDPARELAPVHRVGLPFWLAFLDDAEVRPVVDKTPTTLISREAEPAWSGQLNAATVAAYCEHLHRYHTGLRRRLRARGGDLFVLRTSAAMSEQLRQVTVAGSLLR